MTKTKSDLIQAWCEKGRRDFVTARNALCEDKEIFPDIACFHAQQSAEKYLKGYLVFLDQDFPKTHALEDLVLLAAVKDPGCRKLFTLASELSPYAVEIRYPESSSPSVQDAREAVQSANVILTHVLGMMKLTE
jgi:HEPN domain-containing protein